jgi:predicted phosphoribosyltransferase
MQAHLVIENGIVCAIPAGGVPVGLEIALGARLPFTIVVVRKIQIPWNTEAGFGAMTWDGRIFLNEPFVARLGLTKQEIEFAIRTTRENVRVRQQKFTRDRPMPPLQGRSVIITDDGLASGYTMHAAVQAIRAGSPREVIVAVPTGSPGAISLISREADRIVCLNIRTSYSFAVADAYRQWHDLPDEEVVSMLGRAE